MSRHVNIAAIQMDASPAPTSERLQRAERLVREAVRSGADLVVLPELFNTGYGYATDNYLRAEPLTGQTVTWLKTMSVRHQIHLAGSLMLLDQRAIYNALLLLAPDGRMWRYDKSYPWGWERAYFRGRKGITVAKTDVGSIGFMVCWDVAHAELWRQYAGQIQLMVISSCPPDITNATFRLPNGDRGSLQDVGRIGDRLKTVSRYLFAEFVNRQTAWLGVPAVQAVGSGHIRTSIPNSLLSLIAFLPMAPGLIRYLPQGSGIQLECDCVQGCKIVASDGNVQSELEQAQGEAFAMAEVLLPDKTAVPDCPQPKSSLPRIAYLTSDVVFPFLMLPLYRQGVRHALSRERP